jgi:DNA-binding LacI/PurR family transcriptional regulator
VTQGRWLSQVCNAANYGLIFFLSLEAESVDTLVRRVKLRQLSGYVIAAPTTEAPGLHELFAANAVTYAATNPADASKCPMGVLSDDRLAVRLLVEEMLKQGHRRIAFAGAGGHARAASAWPATWTHSRPLRNVPCRLSCTSRRGSRSPMAWRSAESC